VVAGADGAGGARFLISQHAAATVYSGARRRESHAKNPAAPALFALGGGTRTR
jgi:hypothetical protein